MTIQNELIRFHINKLLLDVLYLRDGVTLGIANAAAAAAVLAAALVGRDTLVVFEATGRYDATLRAALAQTGVAYVRVNPEQARHFARATGRRAKTDAIDARMLAELGSRLALRRTVPADPGRERLTRLTRRRDQLVAMRKQERVRHSEEHDEELRADLAQHLTWLDGQITRLDRAIVQAVHANAALEHAEALLRSVPGIGPVTAAVLLGQLPELGQTSAKAIAALAGLAPYNNDSGAFSGKRSVRGGRKRVRQALYMAALSATRGASPLAAFHRRLRHAGKPPKLAIVATARKLLTTLNAIVRQQTPYLSPA
jgi:transposase